MDVPIPPFQPVYPVQPHFPSLPQGPGPNQPFVLATGAGGGGDAIRGEALGAYRQLLEQYAGLYRRGLLDSQGLQGWQQAWAAYQQLGGA